MGQKVNPNGLRLGVIRTWDARWYAPQKEVPTLLEEDLKIRKYIDKKYVNASVSKTVIERSNKKVIVTVFTAKPGMVIGREGAIKKEVVDELTKLTGKNVFLNVREVKRPDLDATLVAKNIASQLEKRVGVNRALKQAITRVEKTGVQGVKVEISGRLDGHDIAASKHTQVGSLPLQTLRADIDYGVASAHTTYGVVGVKCWIYKGDILGENKLTEQGGNN